MTQSFVVTIDGPAGAGKSTMARRLAAALGFRFLDTGALYRALTLVALEEGLELDDEALLAERLKSMRLVQDELGRTWIDGADRSSDLRTEAVTGAVSRVARHALVRTALVPVQRAFAEHHGLVCEGRDVGSVIFPDADLKVWLDADPAERARRRQRDLEASGESVAPEAIESRLKERDRLDSGREVAPLLRTPEHVLIDSTGNSPEQVMDRLLGLVRAKRGDEGTPAS